MILMFARYGLRELAVFSVLFAGLTVFAYSLFPLSAVIPLCGLAITIYFFRDPVRTPAPAQEEFIAPADGCIADISDCPEDDFIGQPAVKIGIFMSVFNVHVNRVPYSGRVVKTAHKPGEFLNALNKDSIERNENNTSFFENVELGIKFKVRQIAGIIARRIVCCLSEGQTVSAGEKFGMIKFGSRTELYLPKSRVSEITVKKGDKTRAGLTVLARIKIQDEEQK